MIIDKSQPRRTIKFVVSPIKNYCISFGAALELVPIARLCTIYSVVAISHFGLFKWFLSVKNRDGGRAANSSPQVQIVQRNARYVGRC